MRRSHSLRFLYEAFLPREARFPDERFRSRSGDPVAARKNAGPPKGTVGTTSKDWGAHEPSADVGMVDLPHIELGWEDDAGYREIEDRARQLGVRITRKNGDMNSAGYGDVDLRGSKDAIRKFLESYGIDADEEFAEAGIA